MRVGPRLPLRRHAGGWHGPLLRRLSTNVPRYDVAVVADGPLSLALACALQRSPLTAALRVAVLHLDGAQASVHPWAAPALLSPRSVRLLTACNAWGNLQQRQPITHLTIMKLGPDGPSGKLEFDYTMRGAGAANLGFSVLGTEISRALTGEIPGHVHQIHGVTAVSCTEEGDGTQVQYSAGDPAESQSSSSTALKASLVVATLPGTVGLRPPAVTTAARAALLCAVETPPTEGHTAAFYRFAGGALLHYLPLSATSAHVAYCAEASLLEALQAEFEAEPAAFLARVAADVAGDERVPAPVAVRAVQRCSGGGHVLLRCTEGRRAVLHSAASPVGLPGSDPYNLGLYNVVALANALHEGCEVGQDLGSPQVLEKLEFKSKWHAMQALGPSAAATLAYDGSCGPLTLARSLFAGARATHAGLVGLVSGDYVESLRTTVEEH